jgi:hypothetical protein
MIEGRSIHGCLSACGHFMIDLGSKYGGRKCREIAGRGGGLIWREKLYELHSLEHSHCATKQDCVMQSTRQYSK